MSEKSAHYQALPTVADEGLPGINGQPEQKRSPWYARSRCARLAVLAFIGLYLCYPHIRPHGCHGSHNDAAAAKCPAQPSPLNVGNDWDPLADAEYTHLASDRLSRAVQQRTESFDYFIQLEANDPALDKHYAFAQWLKDEYPVVLDKLQYEEVNYHGHLLTWQGSNADLKPILLMAHTDTVPVINETLSQWTYPPFEGTIAPAKGLDGQEVPYIWGRGASDCKNSLLGIFGAVEKLAQEGYEPERTILIASGFDEEIGGAKGAVHIGQKLEERYGHDSIALVFDEGFSGLANVYGTTVAAFGMAEKGAVNTHIQVDTPGGHSSVPPTHTGIGIMSLLLAELEKNPFEPSFDPASPYLKYLNCMADHAPEFPKHVAKDLKRPKKWGKLAKQLAGADRQVNSFLATTQAIDLIQGGVKVNALPEVVEGTRIVKKSSIAYDLATINHRIAFSSSVNETLEHDAATLAPLAKKLGFSFEAFGSLHGNKTERHITLAASGESALEPAPISPAESKAFELMAATARHIFGAKIVTSPTGMYANTDTRAMWNLSKHIYRFTPAFVEENKNVHTVDERISVAGHLNTTRYFYKLLRNAEGWKSD